MCKTSSTRFEISTALPDGADLVRVHRDGETILLVRPGQRLSPSLVHELNHHLAHAAQDCTTAAG
jgi:hypothetical protein